MRVLEKIEDQLRQFRGWPRRDAAVDPARFPEDDFPAHCLACGYLLRGLPDGLCPECGTPFNRGRLLVEHYARQKLPRRGRRYTLLRRLYWVGWIMLIGPYLVRYTLVLGLICTADSSALGQLLLELHWVVLGLFVVQLSAFVPLVAAWVLHLRLLPSRAQCDAVRAELGLPLSRDWSKFRWW